MVYLRVKCLVDMAATCLGGNVPGECQGGMSYIQNGLPRFIWKTVVKTYERRK